MKDILFFFSLLTVCYSCLSEKESITEEMNLNVNLSPKEISIYDLFNRIEVIPIETSDSCFMKGISKVIESSKKYYILDNRLSILFEFDKNGKYLSKIDKTGEGPGEYNLIYDVVIDTLQEKVKMLSPMGSIYYYDMQGNFIEQTKLSWGGQQSIVNLNNKHLAIWSLSSFTKGKHICIFNEDSVQSYKFYWTDNEENFISNQNSFDVFYQYNKNTYFYTSYANNVFTLTEQGIEFAYKWNFYKDNLNLSPYLEMIKEVPDKFNYLIKNQEIPYRFCSQYQNNNYYYTQLYTFSIDRRRNIFYSKKNNNAIVFDKTKENLVLSKPMTFNDNYMICTATYEDIRTYKKVLPEKEFNKISTRTEDDNPFLVKLYFKL